MRCRRSLSRLATFWRAAGSAARAEAGGRCFRSFTTASATGARTASLSLFTCAAHELNQKRKVRLVYRIDFSMIEVMKLPLTFLKKLLSCSKPL